MSEAERPPIEPEVELLRAEVAALRVENMDLRVKLAEATTNIKWFKGVLGVLIGIFLLLLAALVIVPQVWGKKKGSRKSAHEGSLLPLFYLLKDILAAEEVERFLQIYMGPDGLAVFQSLSAATSADDLFHKVLAALDRRGLLDERFFIALIEFIPTQRAYILKVQAEFLTGASAEATVVPLGPRPE